MCDATNSLTAEQNEKEEKLFKYINSLSQPLNQSKRLKSGLTKRDPIVQLRYAKYLLVIGVGVNEVALRTRLPLKAVQDLAVSYNPRFRKISNRRQSDMESLALEMFQRGDDLKKICRFLDLPLFTIVCYLRKQNVKEAVLNSRMPPADDSLYIEFRKTVNRKSKLKYKPLSLH